MQTLYKLKATELNNDFIENIKLLFKDKTIEISVCEATENQPKKNLYQVIENFRQQVSPPDLETEDHSFTELRDRSTGREVSL